MNQPINFAKQLILNLGEDILHVYEKLYSKIPTTLWISDLHGDGERFINVLQGRFGMLYTTCMEALNTKDEKLIKQLTTIIRLKKFEPEKNLTREEVLDNLIKILQYKLDDRLHVDERISDHKFAMLLLKTAESGHIPKIFYQQDELFHFSVLDISESILVSIPEHVVLLGDVFDRGSSPDKIIRILRFPYYRNKLSLIWGNHDILWLGACAQNKSMIAEALRITCRYGHLAFLGRMGINLNRLQKFANKYYKEPTGNFKAKLPEHRSLEKALSVIQFKLEEATIMRNPEFEMNSRLQLTKLSQALKNNELDHLTDVDFPTINPDNPLELTLEEKDIIDDLALQFKNSKKLKHLMELFITDGKIFTIYQNFLNLHALIPCTEDGKYDTVFGLKGKSLLQYFEKKINSIGNKYLQDQRQDIKDTDLLFYLWCGPKSPLFGKDAMKTFERYYFKDKASHKETTLHWDKNLKDLKFQKIIKNDFVIDRIIFGHTPRDVKKGDKMVSSDGFSINIDGGFAGAYLERGHALVRTPLNLYGIVLPTAEEAKISLNDNQSVPAIIEEIEKFKRPISISHISDGNYWRLKETKLLAELKDLRKKAAATYFQISDQY